MLSEVEIRNPQGSQLILPLDDLTDGITVQDISGLEPVKASIVTSNLASQDGTDYRASSREERQIIFKLGMDPVPSIPLTVEAVRNRLYDYFMTNSPVDMTFRTDKPLAVDISGRVESFDAPLFVKEPVATIAVNCFNPDFVDLTPVVVPGATVSDATTFDIDYKGTVKTGIMFELFVNRNVNEFTIYSQSSDGVLRQLDFAAPMVDGQTLTIVTRSRERSAMISSGGSPTSILYGVSPQATWLQLEKGINTIRVYAEGAPIPFAITYLTRYGGL